ncbi:MAG: phosphopantothenoylcysteine decarboxylase [Candidatus Omnitrophica bacterium]|nr:phosphopantothenoylcysteine decarboxylase [Candidatus Omnitrophota bacterium]
MVTKKILITSGPTWVPIDNTRVISNISTGETGLILAKKFAGLGAKVTLLLGPVNKCCVDKKIRVINFKYFDELLNLVNKELKSKYDVVIHAAAVSDYRAQKVSKKKVCSSLKYWKLDLVPLPKIIDRVKKVSPSSFLVGFKYEPCAKKEALIKEARMLISRTKADLVVANSQNKGVYSAYIVEKNNISSPAHNKAEMVDKLINSIDKKLWKN